jgi:hypothetical protein
MLSTVVKRFKETLSDYADLQHANMMTFFNEVV